MDGGTYTLRVGFFAREQLKILLWRDGVEMAESVRFVIERYHQSSTEAKALVLSAWRERDLRERTHT